MHATCSRASRSAVAYHNARKIVEAQFVPDKNDMCATTLTKVVTDEDGEEVKIKLSVIIRRA